MHSKALCIHSSSHILHCSLQESDTYFVELRVTNGAELSRSVVSYPVLVDVTSPTPGSVKHGDNFKADIAYQNSLTEMHGTL